MNTPDPDRPSVKKAAALNADLLTEIRCRAVTAHRPDASPYLSLLHQDELTIVQVTGASHQAVQIMALSHDIIPERYARNQRTLSNQAQIQLLKAHVAIIGLGGLGGAVTEILARMGIGRLTLVDGDAFQDSNLNRQLLSGIDTLGRPKAEVAAHRVARINPAVETRVYPVFLTPDNQGEILSGVSIGVDCLDSITARFILEQGCRQQGIPMVSAAIGGTAGQATVIMPGDPGLQAIYGDPSGAPEKGIEASLGTLPFAATAMAAIECAEIVALATGRPSQLRHKLLIADFSCFSMEILSLQ